jgi:hypothetical protein
MLGVFASHLLLEATGIVDWWLKLIGGRSMENARVYCKQANPELNKRFMVAYTARVQTVADSTLHLLALYTIIRIARV